MQTLIKNGSVISTSVPAPGAVCTTPTPPTLAKRPMIESRTPWRSAGADTGSKPTPRSRTNTVVLPGPTSTNRDMSRHPENLAALTNASRVAATSAAARTSTETGRKAEN